MEKYAFFLPQFHEIKENNEWWGKGFTEWVNVKNAKPLFKGHKQPKVPIDGYYNLLNKETVIHQTELMHKYGIDGMIYYHYYFEGRMLLEKPAENLLKWKDIDQPFFFCWANHSWNRSWEGKTTILLEQTYGKQEEWEKHFQYLLKFFKDKRYIKKDNKPLIMIFNPNFEEKVKIFNYFNKRCKENGFDGIILINSCNNEKDYNKTKIENVEYSSYYFFREPTYSISLSRNFCIKVIQKLEQIFKIQKFRIYNGDKLLKNAIKKMKHNKYIIHGLFFEWDNTPRHKKRGYVITPISHEMFINYMNNVRDEEFLFINAWNEWAEGMILEGTEENGYKYLEWIKEFSKR